MEILQNISDNNILINAQTTFRLDLAWEEGMQEFEKDTLKSIINPTQNFETVRYVHSGYTSTNGIYQNDIWFYFYFYDNTYPPVHRPNYEYVGITAEQNVALLRQDETSFFRLEFYKVPDGELPNSGNRKLVFTKHLPIPLGERIFYTPFNDYVFVPVFTGSNYRNKENMYLYWFQDNTVLDGTLLSGDTFYMTARYFNNIDGTTIPFLNNGKEITDVIDEENDLYNRVVINRSDYSYVIYSGNTDHRIGTNTAGTAIKFYAGAIAGSSIYPPPMPTPSPTPGLSPSLTPTITPSISLSRTVTPTRTVSRSVTLTPTPSRSVMATPTVSSSITSTPDPTGSPMATPSISATPGLSPSLTPTITPSISISASLTPSITPSITLSITPSISISATLTPTVSSTPASSPPATPSVTPSISISTSLTPSITPSLTPSISISASLTPSLTPSISISASLTPSRTPSRTPSITPSISISASLTPSLTPSRTPSISPSRTPTLTPSISISASLTPTLTPTITPSISPSRTPTITPSITPSISISASLTPSLTPTITPSQPYISMYIENNSTDITVPVNGVTVGGSTVINQSGFPIGSLESGSCRSPQGINYWDVEVTLNNNSVSKYIYAYDSNNDFYCYNLSGSESSVTLYNLYLDNITQTQIYIMNSGSCPSPTPSVTRTPSVTPSLTRTPTVTPSLTRTPSLTITPTPTYASMSVTPTTSTTPSLTISPSAPVITIGFDNASTDVAIPSGGILVDSEPVTNEMSFPINPGNYGSCRSPYGIGTYTIDVTLSGNSINKYIYAYDSNNDFHCYNISAIDETVTLYNIYMNDITATQIYLTASGSCPSPSPTPSKSPTVTPSLTRTPSLTMTPTGTYVSMSVTPTISVTPTLTITPTESTIVDSVSASPTTLNFTKGGNAYTQDYSVITSSGGWTADVETGNDPDDVLNTYTSAGDNGNNLSVTVNINNDIYEDVTQATITITCGTAVDYLTICRDGSIYTCS